MKKTILLTLIFFGLLQLTNAQEQTYSNIRSAIKAGNAKGLMIFFDNYVELKTDKEEGSFSKKQSEFLLSSFFSENEPVSFSYDYQGNTTNGKKYAIGTYSSSKGDYRVYMKLKLLSDDTYTIETLDFSPTEE